MVVALLTGNLTTLSLRYSPALLFSSVFSSLSWNISTILTGYVLTLLPGYLFRNRISDCTADLLGYRVTDIILYCTAGLLGYIAGYIPVLSSTRLSSFCATLLSRNQLALLSVDWIAFLSLNLFTNLVWNLLTNLKQCFFKLVRFFNLF